MKRTLLIICALCFTQSAFAALDRDYFDYTQSSEYQSIPTDTSAALPSSSSSYTNANGSAPQMTERVVTKRVLKTITDPKGKKRIRFGNEGSSWINTYWNFGQPVYGETGRF